MKVIVVFSSMTSANNIKNYLLKKYNIQTKLRQTPKNLSLSGCSYCLLADYKDIETIKKIARENSLNIRGIFKEDGTLAEPK